MMLSHFFKHHITFYQIDRYKEGFRVSEVYRIPQLLIVGICGYLWAFLGICGPTWCKVAGWLGIWGIRWQCGGKGRGSVHLRDVGGHCRWCRWLALVSSSRQRTPLYHQVGDTHTPAACSNLWGRLAIAIGVFLLLLKHFSILWTFDARRQLPYLMFDQMQWLVDVRYLEYLKSRLMYTFSLVTETG